VTEQTPLHLVPNVIWNYWQSIFVDDKLKLTDHWRLKILFVILNKSRTNVKFGGSPPTLRAL